MPIFNDLNDTAVTDFFTSPWTFAHGIQDGKGTLRPVRQADGSIMCYLSLIEALIEAARLRLFGLTCQTLPTASINRRWFLNANETGYVARVHLGWHAHDGALLTRPSGCLFAQSHVMHRMHGMSHSHPTFEVTTDALIAYVRVREAAGLFAWQETHASVLQWSPARLAGVVQRALYSMDVTLQGEQRALQLALFDPEFEQWHFVPQDIVTPHANLAYLHFVVYIGS